MPTPPTPSRSDLALQRRIARERFLKARIAEREYARHLVGVGKHVGAIVLGFVDKGKVSESDFEKMKRSLSAYSKLLTPWASSVTTRMQNSVARRDLQAWTQLSRSLGSALHTEIAKAPIAAAMHDLHAEQVKLITTIPLEAIDRVHELSLAAMISGERAAESAKEIMRTGHVCAFNAIRIARTEASRTATTLTMTRAEYVGSDSYIWHSLMDGDQRKRHGELNGTVQKWSEPPIVTEPNAKKVVRAHCGCWVFCRCFCEPLVPDHIL